MRLRPLHDRIVIRPIDPESKTLGGIIIPDTARNDTRATRGIVAAVGPGGHHTKSGGVIAPDVTAGDQVLFEQSTATNITLDDETIAIVNANDILGVFDQAQTRAISPANKKPILIIAAIVAAVCALAAAIAWLALIAK